MYPAPAFESKICPPDQLAARVASLPRPLVFTNGCFDILHRGHVTYLGQARALGAAMVVALNSDASVRRQGKGDDRPINTLEDRLAVMASLGCVDLVTWFDEDTPIARILECQPDVLVKGGGAHRRRPRNLRPGRQRAFHPLRAPALHHLAAREDPPALKTLAKRALLIPISAIDVDQVALKLISD